MTEEPGGPLLVGITIALADKNADKRKSAAVEFESRVREVLRSPGSRDQVARHFAASAAAAVNAGSGPVAFGMPLGSQCMGRSEQSIHEQASRAISCLVDDFCAQASPSRRKGGLLGLSSLAIALGHKPVQMCISKLVPPVLKCFSDEDPSVRYSACEAFYNVAKVARHGILDSHMGDVFDGLCRLYADVDPSVKEGGQFLDRLIRDIVTETKDFKYSEFIPILTTRIRVLNPSVLQLVLGWITLLDSVPQVDMIVYLPQYLEGLFNILRSENRDIRRNASLCLDGLLEEIKSAASETPPTRARRAIADSASIVARCCRAGEWRSEDEVVRSNALKWLLDFVALQVMLDAAESVNDGGLRGLLPVFLSGALNCIEGSAGDNDTENKQVSRLVGQLKEAGRRLGPQIPVEEIVDALRKAMQDGRPQECGKAVLLKCFDWAQLLLDQCPERVLRSAVRSGLMEAALASVLKPEEEVAVAALQLISKLTSPLQERMSSNDTLVSDGVVRADVGSGPWPSSPSSRQDLFLTTCRDILAIVGQEVRVTCKRRHPLAAEPKTFGRWTCAVCQGFCEQSNAQTFRGTPSVETSEMAYRCTVCDYELCSKCWNKEARALSSRLELVVRKVCEGVSVAHLKGTADRFYATAAPTVREQEIAEVSRRLVRVLNRVLLTSRETRDFRRKLQDEALVSPRPGDGSAGEVPKRLLDMLTAWFYDPVSTFSLCLWLHWFEMAEVVIGRLALLEQTPLMREQLQEVAELLESPVFMRVRLQLLGVRRHPALLRAVVGLSVLLPKETALKTRLEFVQIALMLDRSGKARTAKTTMQNTSSGFSGFLQWARHGEGPAHGAGWVLARFDAATEDFRPPLKGLA